VKSKESCLTVDAGLSSLGKTMRALSTELSSSLAGPVLLKLALMRPLKYPKTRFQKYHDGALGMRGIHDL
jgi:hypothetical protein